MNSDIIDEILKEKLLDIEEAISEGEDLEDVVEDVLSQVRSFLEKMYPGNVDDLMDIFEKRLEEEIS